MEQRFRNVHGGHNGNLYDYDLGDADGQEYLVREWYNDGWAEVYRYPDPNVANTIAALAIKAANNDNIGYNNDSTVRVTFWNELTRVNYDPSAIAVPCAANCSSSTVAIVKAAGELLGVEALKQIPSDAWTYNANYSSRGFQTFTSFDYTGSTEKLQPGDLLNAPGKHIVIFVGNGETSGSAPYGTFHYEIDDITINLDEQAFEFAGTPKTVTYSGRNLREGWVFEKISEFISYVSGILTNGIFIYSPLGWGMSFQAIINSSLKHLEGS